MSFSGASAFSLIRTHDLFDELPEALGGLQAGGVVIKGFGKIEHPLPIELTPAPATAAPETSPRSALYRQADVSC
jgi:hypothetical protein